MVLPQNAFTESDKLKKVKLMNGQVVKEGALAGFYSIFHAAISIKLNLNTDPNCLGYVRKVGDWCPSGDYVMQSHVTEIDAQNAKT